MNTSSFLDMWALGWSEMDGVIVRQRDGKAKVTLGISRHAKGFWGETGGSWRKIAVTLIDPANVYVSGVASHFGFVSLPHFLGSSLCIFSIAFAVSGWFSRTRSLREPSVLRIQPTRCRREMLMREILTQHSRWRPFPSV